MRHLKFPKNFGDCSRPMGDSNQSAQQGRVRGALIHIVEISTALVFNTNN